MSRKYFNIPSSNKGGHFKSIILKMRDEAMILLKDQLDFKVYMPSKPDRYDIKAYLVSDSWSDYISNMEVCTGKL
jgi:hypothetical protein